MKPNHHIWLGLIAAAMWAASGTGGAEEIHPAEATITFAGMSTLDDFTGHVTADPFAIHFVENPTNHWPECAAEVTVTITNMNTAKARRDRNMYAMFGAEAHPLIRGVVEHLPVPRTSRQLTELRLKIAGRERTIPAMISDWHEADGQISFHLVFDVSLRAFGLKAPSIVGLIRVADNVHVDCDVKARPSQPSGDSQP